MGARGPGLERPPESRGGVRGIAIPWTPAGGRGPRLRARRLAAGAIALPTAGRGLREDPIELELKRGRIRETQRSVRVLVASSPVEARNPLGVPGGREQEAAHRELEVRDVGERGEVGAGRQGRAVLVDARSEERRVGKECRL